MGRKSRNQGRISRMDETDYETASTSSTATSSDINGGQEEEEERDEESLLDGFIDDLYEKRAKTREDGLKGLVSALKSHVLTDYVALKCETIVHQCINSIKKGAGTEITYASQIIGLIIITLGAEDDAQRIASEASPHLIRVAKLGIDPKARIAALESLALTCFVGSPNYEATEEVMDVLWLICKHKGNHHADQTLGINKPSTEVRASALSAWSFLLTRIPTARVISHHMPECIVTLSSSLGSQEQAVRLSAGDAVALLFEAKSSLHISEHARSFEDTTCNLFSDTLEKKVDIKEAELVEQVRSLAIEAGGKGQANKKAQRSSFKEILAMMEGGDISSTTLKLQQGDTLVVESWSRTIQLKFLTGILAEGLQRHLQENALLHEIFSFVPRQDRQPTLSAKEKRMYMSPNSLVSKARTQNMNRKRSQVHACQVGHFNVAEGDCD